MLHGRESLICSIPFPKNSNWLDVGGGTGYSINIIKKNINEFNRIDIIEYSKSMFTINHWIDIWIFCVIPAFTLDITGEIGGPPGRGVGVGWDG